MKKAYVLFDVDNTLYPRSSGLGKAMIGLLEHESGPEVAAKLALQGRVGVDPSVAA